MAALAPGRTTTRPCDGVAGELLAAASGTETPAAPSPTVRVKAEWLDQLRAAR